MSTTLKDLAQITGYSAITISRAINTPEKVKKATRDKILAEIEKHRYFPNNVAKALVYNRTNIVFVYIPNDLSPTNQFVMQVNAGISEYLGKHGYSLLVSRHWYHQEAADGLILMGLSESDEIALRSLAKEKPLVLFGHDPWVDCIDIDNFEGMRLITEFAIKTGHLQPAFFGINQAKKFTKDRYLGYQKALAEQHIIENKSHVIFTDNNSDAGFKEATTLIKKYPEINCIICSSDDQAIGALRAAQEMGKRVPEDLAITGFDGLGSELVTYPKLTTIHQPIFEAGMELAKRLLEKIKHPDNQGPVVSFYKPSLVIHDTCR